MASHKGRRYRCAVSLAVLAAAGFSAWAAPVVVTPGTLAGSVYSRQDPPGSGSGGSGPVERMNTCIVTPTADDRTLVMSTRDWHGRTTPVTVLFTMVGGGPGIGPNSFAQLASAGGSSAILKNGTVVGSANGGNAGATTRNIVSGSFTVSSTDTLRFVAGGGAGSGAWGYSYPLYCWIDEGGGNGYDYYTFQYYGWPGGGGGGYFGGGAGQYYQNSCSSGYPAQLPGVATGGTGTAGGLGSPGNGSLGYGGYNSSSGYDGYAGGTGGGAKSVSLWSGYGMAYYVIGAGGGAGQPGGGGGSALNGCPAPSDMPSSMPIASAYNVDPTSGAQGYAYGGYDPWGYYYNCNSGGGRGQIVLKYQAAACDLIPNYNAP